MQDDQLAFMSATDLAAAIRARRVSPVEVVRAALDRIHRAQPVLNAFITIAEDTAMAQAWEAEAAIMRGEVTGPLHGVPVAVKDLVPTQGIRTTWGSLIFKDHVPDTDAVVVARLKRAGAIIVGKTTTPEFGQQCLTAVSYTHLDVYKRQDFTVLDVFVDGAQYLIADGEFDRQAFARRRDDSDEVVAEQLPQIGLHTRDIERGHRSKVSIGRLYGGSASFALSLIHI